MARNFTFGVRITGDAKDGIQTMQLTERELKDLRRELQRTDRGFQNGRRGFRGWARGMLDIRGAIGPLIGVAGVGMLGRLAQGAIATTSELGKAANTADVTAESLQELRFAFGELAGVTESQVDVALQRFNRRLGLAADGTGAAKDTFGELGVAIRDASGSIRDSEPVLDEVLVQLSRIDNDAQRAAKASEIFGEEAGPRLASALEGGIGGMNDARQAARDLGLVMSEDAVEAAERLDDRFNRLSNTIGTAFKTAVVEAGQAISDLVDQLSDPEPGRGLVGALNEDLASLNERLMQRGLPVPVEESIRRQREEVVRRLGELQRFAAAERNFGSDGVGLPQIVDTAGPMDVRRTLGGIPSMAPPLPSIDDLAARNRQLGMERQAFLDEQRMEDFEKAARGANDTLAMMDGTVVDLGLSFDEVNKEADRMSQLGADIGMTFASAFEDAIVQAQGFRDILQGLAQDLARLVLRQTVTVPLANAVTQGLNFGGARAGGGPVSSGSAYLVGERGPELFMPGRSGTIVPNGASGPITVQSNVTIQGNVDSSDRVREIEAAAQAAASEGARRVMSQMRRGGAARKLSRG